MGEKDNKSHITLTETADRFIQDTLLNLGYTTDHPEAHHISAAQVLAFARHCEYNEGDIVMPGPCKDTPAEQVDTYTDASVINPRHHDDSIVSAGAVFLHTNIVTTGNNPEDVGRDQQDEAHSTVEKDAKYTSNHQKR